MDQARATGSAPWCRDMPVSLTAVLGPRHHHDACAMSRGPPRSDGHLPLGLRRRPPGESRPPGSSMQLGQPRRPIAVHGLPPPPGAFPGTHIRPWSVSTPLGWSRGFDRPTQQRGASWSTAGIFRYQLSRGVRNESVAKRYRGT